MGLIKYLKPKFLHREVTGKLRHTFNKIEKFGGDGDLHLNLL